MIKQRIDELKAAKGMNVREAGSGRDTAVRFETRPFYADVEPDYEENGSMVFITGAASKKYIPKEEYLKWKKQAKTEKTGTAMRSARSGSR